MSLAIAVACGVAAGCDGLLDVDLPTTVTEADLTPVTASPQVKGILGLVECAYSGFVMDASGFEDNWQRTSGVAGVYSEFRNEPGGGPCDEDSYSTEWADPLLIARRRAYDTYEAIQGWSGNDGFGDPLVEDREELLALTSMYTAITLEVFGAHFCEFAISTGPIATPTPGALLTPAQTLAVAEGWVDSALAWVDSAGGDFDIDLANGEVSPSITETLMGLKARIVWAKGDTAYARAATFASAVTDGHMAYVLREEGEDRRNMVASMQGNGGGTQAGGFLQGVVRLKATGNTYGYSEFGTIPGTATTWPDSIPLTGYLNLAVTAEGAAVDANGYAIRTATMGAGGMADTRVQHAPGSVSGSSGADEIVERKYTGLADDIPLVNWREMRLIQAEAAGPGATATALINSIRAADGILPISGAYQTTVEAALPNPAFRYMILEERRRALWLEGRFWSAKIQNTDIAWFPRLRGYLVNPAATYNMLGGVRMLMPEEEYRVNPNFGLSARGTGCDADQAPIFT